MTLKEMIDRQMYLNGLLPTKPTVEQLVLATAAEVGELVQALKYGVKDPAIAGWCWWSRPDKPGKPSTKEEVLGELVDIWHFVLSILICGEVDNNSAENTYKRLWDNTYKRLWDEAVSWPLHFFVEGISSRYYFQGIIGAAKCLGFTKEEFEDAYWAKTEENIKRWGANNETNQ